MNDLLFSAEDSVLIFEFLSFLVEAVDKIDIIEGQLIVGLLPMLTKNTARE